ncbi:MAG TPA: PaaX family transcriptional regulator C-terminal domain-containing protein [bacterium]|nr:PaaX family transcriptional regulator C-terminal domain-containing protein [bacterium]
MSATPSRDPRGAPTAAAGGHARSMLFTLFGDYVRHYGGTVWIGSLIALMGELGFTGPAVRAAVSRTTRQGWLAAIRAGRASYYALTPRGEARIEEAAGRIFKLRPERWDGVWRIVVLPPIGDRERRAALRRELEWMGFAALARGVHVAANNLLDRMPALADRYAFGEGAGETFAARLAGDGDAAAFAARHWDLPAIDAAYAAFAGEWRPRLVGWRAAAARTGGVLDLPGGDAFREKTRLVHEFRKFLFVDPGLPAEVLPARWNGVEARGIFSAAYHLLAEAALGFFETHYRPAPGREADVAEGRRNARRDPFRPAAVESGDLR